MSAPTKEIPSAPGITVYATPIDTTSAEVDIYGVKSGEGYDGGYLVVWKASYGPKVGSSWLHNRGDEPAAWRVKIDALHAQ